MSTRIKSTFHDYIGQPAMRLFWVFLILVLAVIAINILYLPDLWRLISAGILVAAAILIFISSIRTARSEFESRRDRNLLEAITTNLEDAVIAYDDRFTILAFNTAAEKLFRLPAKEIVGQQINYEVANRNPRLKLLATVLFPSLAPVIVKKSEPGKYPQIVDIVFEDPFLQLQLMTAQITDESGNTIGFLKLVHDRTREIALLKSKNEFITVTSHQLRTPLTGISWAFQELARPDLPDDQRQEIIGSGVKTAGQLTQTVNDLLDAAKVEEGQFGYNFQELEVGAFIQKIVEEAAVAARAHKANVYFEKPMEKIMVSIDEQKLGIALSNLLDNAIKYNVENGEVTVRVKKLPNKPFIEVSVADTGVGLPGDDVKKLFSKFFRAENTVKIDPNGLGLGLYLVRNIIRQHGGEVWAESVLGRGSTFYFTLPTDRRLVPQKEIGNVSGE